MQFVIQLVYYKDIKMKLTHQMLTAAAVLVSSSAAFATDVSTQTGQELGVSLSHYKQDIGFAVDDWTEKDSIKGEKLGIDYSTSMALENDWFFSLAGRFAYGKSDVDSNYSGVTLSDNNPDWYTDIKLTFGKDFISDNYSVSPYTGLGYLYKHQKADATYTEGYTVTLKRKSFLVYLPLGLKHRIALDSQSALATTIEYDYVVAGKQKNNAEIYGYSIDDSYDKDSGFGFKLASMYQFNDLSVGPFFEYWKLDKSNKSDYGYQELKDKSVEFGIKASMRF